MPQRMILHFKREINEPEYAKVGFSSVGMESKIRKKEMSSQRVGQGQGRVMGVQGWEREGPQQVTGTGTGQEAGVGEKKSCGKVLLVKVFKFYVQHSIKLFILWYKLSSHPKHLQEIIPPTTASQYPIYCENAKQRESHIILSQMTFNIQSRKNYFLCISKLQIHKPQKDQPKRQCLI